MSFIKIPIFHELFKGLSADKNRKDRAVRVILNTG